MAKGVNMVILLGNVGQEPEIKYTPNGTKIARLSLATAKRRKDRDGEWREETAWHRVAFFGKTAQVVEDYVGKGSRILVTGEIEYRNWEDDKGQKHYLTEIIGHELNLLDGKKEGKGKGTGPGRGNDAPPDEDDLPF